MTMKNKKQMNRNKKTSSIKKGSNKPVVKGKYANTKTKSGKRP